MNPFLAATRCFGLTARAQALKTPQVLLEHCSTVFALNPTTKFIYTIAMSSQLVRGHLSRAQPRMMVIVKREFQNFRLRHQPIPKIHIKPVPLCCCVYAPTERLIAKLAGMISPKCMALSSLVLRVMPEQSHKKWMIFCKTSCLGFSSNRACLNTIPRRDASGAISSASRSTPCAIAIDASVQALDCLRILIRRKSKAN